MSPAGIRKPPALSLSLFGFIGVVCFADFLSGMIGAIQTAALVPAAKAGAVLWFLRLFGDPFGIAGTGLEAVYTLFMIQIFLSVFVLCIFYAVVFATAGQYTLSDCIAAVFVFMLESLPFICGLPLWGLFAAFLRWRTAFGSPTW